MTWQRILIAGRLQLRYVPQFDNTLPAYVFDRLRATCEACSHCVHERSKQGDAELLCMRGGIRQGCSLRRLPGSDCGPDATGYVAGPVTEIQALAQHVIVPQWSATDLQLLRDNYANSSTRDLAIACRKSMESVFRRASTLGLRKSPEQRSRTSSAVQQAQRMKAATAAMPRIEVVSKALPPGIAGITRHHLL